MSTVPRKCPRQECARYPRRFPIEPRFKLPENPCFTPLRRVVKFAVTSLAANKRHCALSPIFTFQFSFFICRTGPSTSHNPPTTRHSLDLSHLSVIVGGA